ncbi:hypothetical protein Y032_0121g1016 [Ancylostoma ceylanicum]|uniref:Uncharacterized protein n=1 Tax=Ancylostoma ceylanicum TaxID=53326 RepID=A0A016TA64_9BILA|nr:hypothetical protein Y032_0121g1016 [Ancylostoma ceylanicum]
MSILDQLLPPDPNSEVRPSSTGPPPDIRSQPKAPKINRNVPILEQLQPQHTSAMSMKAAEQLEQFKLQAKLKEEKVWLLMTKSARFQIVLPQFSAEETAAYG